MKKILFLFLIILTGSCTVQKRLFRPGYSIEWNKRHQTSIDKITILENEDEKHELITISSDIIADSNQEKCTNTSNDKIEFSNEKKIELFNKNENTIINENTFQTREKSKIEEHSTKKYAPQTGITSFVFSMICLIGWIFFFFISSEFIIGLIIISGLLGILFGRNAIKKHKNNPENYKHKWPSYLGFFLCLTSTILFLITLALTEVFLANWGG